MFTGTTTVRFTSPISQEPRSSARPVAESAKSPPSHARFASRGSPVRARLAPLHKPLSRMHLRAAAFVVRGASVAAHTMRTRLDLGIRRDSPPLPIDSRIRRFTWSAGVGGGDRGRRWPADVSGYPIGCPVSDRGDRRGQRCPCACLAIPCGSANPNPSKPWRMPPDRVIGASSVSPHFCGYAARSISLDSIRH